MNVSLTPELEKLVADKVASGMYQTASEVVREGLRLVKEQDVIYQMRLDDLRRELNLGLEQIARGEYGPLDVEQFIAEVKQEFWQKQSHKGA